MWNAHYQNSVIGSVPSYPSDFVAEFLREISRAAREFAISAAVAEDTRQCLLAWDLILTH